MNQAVTIIQSNKKFTPLYFYTDFLNRMADFYSLNNQNVISFRLFEKGDEDIYNSNYWIDPITVPLLLSIIEQLSKFHKKPLQLLLNNNHSTLSVLKFLSQIQFFSLVGKRNPGNMLGNNTLDFDEGYLGGFNKGEIRKEHIVRAYIKNDFNSIDFNLKNEITLRDHVNTLTTYKVQDHFRELLFENEHTLYNHNTYIDILSELITNGVIHSGTTTYAMMFVDKYKTKFSITDNGVGLKTSLGNKNLNCFYYSKNELSSSLNQINSDFDKNYVSNLIDIFEALFYSSLKERRGLFDLMINVVLGANGYFRLHTDNCQIIMSNRIFSHISTLQQIRGQILELHNLNELKKLDDNEYKTGVLKLKEEIKNEFKNIVLNTLEYYSVETKFSSIRFFNVKFKGVHIEVEIPN